MRTARIGPEILRLRRRLLSMGPEGTRIETVDDFVDVAAESLAAQDITAAKRTGMTPAVAWVAVHSDIKYVGMYQCS